MPLYHFRCPDGHLTRKILEPEQAKVDRTCPQCQKPLRRDVKPPTAQAVERLDNGWMTKVIERPADAERLFKERADADPRNKPD